MLFPTILFLFPTFFWKYSKVPLHLNGRWFLQIIDIGNFNRKLNGRWFPQIVDRDSGNLFPIYIYKIVVLVSEFVGGRFRATRVALYCLNLEYDFKHQLFTVCRKTAC